MSRGRKAIVQNNSDWESVFYNSVGTYVHYINLKLSEHIKAEPLSNHIKIVGGYAFKSSQYKKHGVPVIRISDFSNERIILDDVVYYDESKDLERYELHEGDIVIALTGGTIAKLGIVQKGIGKLYLNQRVGKFEVLNSDEFENEYVYWIARSVQSIIKNLAWGAAIPNVSPKQIEELQFPIPDKDTQNGIIDFLNDLKANKLEENREYFNNEVEDFVFSLQVNQISIAELQSELIYQQNLLKQIRQSFFHEAMQGKLVSQNYDDGNALDLLDLIRKEKKEFIGEKKFKKEKETPVVKEEEISFSIPENWTWCRLGDICMKIHYGFNASAKPDKKDVRLLRITDIQNNHVDWDSVPGCDYSISDLENYSLNENDIVIARTGGTIGKTYLIKGITVKSLFASYLIRAIPSKNISPEFLKSFMESPNYWKQLKAAAWGAGQPNVNGTSLSNLIVSLPPLKEQERIVNKLEVLMNVCDKINNSVIQSKIESEWLMKKLLNEALGVESVYDISKDKTLKKEIRKFQNTETSFERIKMKILEILQTSQEPISATVLWNSSEYSKDIELFYAELKRLIDIEKLVVEEKRGKESFLKLATNEN